MTEFRAVNDLLSQFFWFFLVDFSQFFWFSLVYFLFYFTVSKFYFTVSKHFLHTLSLYFQFS